MDDAERWAAILAGVAGLVAFVGGSMVSRLPRVDADDHEVVDVLARRRRPILNASALSLTGCALLLWPIVAVSCSPGDAWDSLRLLSIALWILGFGVLGVADVAVAGLVWRDPAALDVRTLRLVLDTAHLATWSVSAPLGALAVVVTTVVGWQGEVLGTLAALAAVAKVITVVVEVRGTNDRRGWNAGGWAAGISGYVTVLWFALVLRDLAW